MPRVGSLQNKPVFSRLIIGVVAAFLVWYFGAWNEPGELYSAYVVVFGVWALQVVILFWQSRGWSGEDRGNSEKAPLLPQKKSERSR